MSRILPFVIIILAIILLFTYVKPTWDGDIANTRKSIDSYNSALEASARFSEKEASLEVARNQLPPDDLVRLDAFLPDSVDNIQLILDLNALAGRSGVTLSNFVTSNVPNAVDSAVTNSPDGAIAHPSAAVDSLTITVTATGSYNAFRTFLSGIEQSLRPLDVTSLAVTNSETGVYTYQMMLKFYWLH